MLLNVDFDALLHVAKPAGPKQSVEIVRQKARCLICIVERLRFSVSS